MFAHNKKWSRPWAVALVTAIAAPAAFSAPSQQSQATGDAGNYRLVEKPLWLFGSAGIGYGNVSGDEYQANPDGSQIALGGLLSYYTSNWVLDGGINWAYTSVSGRYRGNKVAIRTRAGEVELNPRYRLSDSWQLGPVASVYFGSDNGYGPTVGQNEIATMVGGKLVLEMPTADYAVRLFAKVTTDISIAERNLLVSMVGVQFGFPLSGKPRTEVAEIQKQEPIIVAQAAPVMPKKVEILRINLPVENIYFRTAKHDLNRTAEILLEDIGKYLAAHEGTWGAMEISGHTDPRGGLEYNQALSERRAASVIAAIARGGANPAKMKPEAFGFSKLVDTGMDKDSLAKNRRVELVFRNVQDGAVLKAKIEELAKVAAPLPDSDALTQAKKARINAVKKMVQTKKSSKSSKSTKTKKPQKALKSSATAG